MTFKRTRFSDKQIADMVMMLIGEIEPIGKTTADDKRFDNLLSLQNTIDILLDEIYGTCGYHDYNEYSMQKAGKQAIAWMEEKKDWLIDIFAEGE